MAPWVSTARSAMVARVLGLFGRKREDEHTRTRNLASDYIDGELDADTASSTKSHLDMCPPCRSFFETLRATITLLRSSKGPGAPASFLERLRSSLREEEKR